MTIVLICNTSNVAAMPGTCRSSHNVIYQLAGLTESLKKAFTCVSSTSSIHGCLAVPCSPSRSSVSNISLFLVTSIIFIYILQYVYAFVKVALVVDLCIMIMLFHVSAVLRTKPLFQLLSVRLNGTILKNHTVSCKGITS